MKRTAIARVMSQVAIVALAIAGTGQVHAQSGQDNIGSTAGSEEQSAEDSGAIIVTARFREESVQDIGASITAISAENIVRAGLTDFEDIARRSPGLAIVDRGPNQNDVSIRGISNGVPPQTADGGNMAPLVTQYFDDVLFSSTTAAQRDVALFDIDRVEVLRGPQPTLFGEGAVGGAIRYFSKNPSLDGGVIEGRFNSGIENTGKGDVGYKAQGAIGASLIPGVLGMRLMGYYRKDGGFIDNPITGKSDANDFESYGGRIVVLARPTEKLTLRFSAHIQRDTPGEDWGIDPGNAPHDLTFSTAQPADRFDDLDIYSGRISYDFGNFELTSITGYNKRKSFRNVLDAGNTGAIKFLYPQIADPSTFSAVQYQQKNLTQELRLVSQLDGPINFTTGLLYSDNKSGNIVDVRSAGLKALTVDPEGLLPGESVFFQLNDIGLKQYSGFVEFTFEPVDNLHLISGVRYVDQKLTSVLTSNASATIGAPAPLGVTDFVNLLNNVLGLGTRFSFKLEEFLPRFGIEYAASPELLIYANAAKGVRNGGLNSPLSAIGAPNGFNDAISFEQDSVWSYEAGVKSTLADGDLILNAALFYNKFNKPQVQFVPVATQLYANGPDSRVMGIEIESSFRITPDWSVFVNGIYNDAEFTQTQSLGAAGVIAKGNRPQGTARFSFAAGTDVTTPLSGSLEMIGHADIQHVGSRYAVPQNFSTSKLGSLTLANLRLGVGSDNWTLTAFVNNLFDDIEYQALAVLNTAPGTPVTSASVNRPRTYGLSLDFNF